MSLRRPSRASSRSFIVRSRTPTLATPFSATPPLGALIDQRPPTDRRSMILAAMHKMMREYWERNPRPPPVNEPTPQQYRIAKYGFSKEDKAKRAAEKAKREGGDGRHEPPMPDWPAQAGVDLLQEGAGSPGAPAPVRDEGVIKHIFEMSMNCSSNENVQRILHEKTKTKFPEIFQQGSPNMTSFERQ